MVHVDAEKHKVLGNKLFGEHRYEDAISEYSTAIIKDSNEKVYYTNRALCYSRLEEYDKVINDTRRAIELDNTTVKAYYLLGQALIHKKQHAEALAKLKIAYDLAMQQKVKYINDILQALLMARKKKWDDDEVVRLEKECELLRYVENLVEKERTEQLDQNKDDPDKMDEINYNSDERLAAIQQVFKQSQHQPRPPLPQAYLDPISFNVLHQPYITPDGITYERQSLLEHFERNGHFDPITRNPCTEKDLIPNLSLRESIEDFLKDNGWAADY
ncbi:Stub1 protein [Halteromyces radiatus]|uniref:Stub1 protein n=1 Tax=Halteromyces radiatus TaxID=101107 RepID=UPI00221FB7BB|nr:Stub1 protein [Halteromyces radiatus]KAI8089304.1 Stub1 protein [Halteromyces radiatus]